MGKGKGRVLQRVDSSDGESSNDDDAGGNEQGRVRRVVSSDDDEDTNDTIRTRGMSAKRARIVDNPIGFQSGNGNGAKSDEESGKRSGGAQRVGVIVIDDDKDGGSTYDTSRTRKMSVKRARFGEIRTGEDAKGAVPGSDELIVYKKPPPQEHSEVDEYGSLVLEAKS